MHFLMTSPSILIVKIVTESKQNKWYKDEIIDGACSYEKDKQPGVASETLI